MILYIILGLAALLCAVQSIRSGRLLTSAIWLAGVSALSALVMYLLGAHQVAVIELSVGAGLVTVLFVFAINISGEEVFKPARMVPGWLAASIALVAAALLIRFTFQPQPLSDGSGILLPFSMMLWEVRGIDIILQGLVTFAGVLVVLGLMADGADKMDKEVHS
ncbi:MAG: hypothetical protein JW704_11830 [Anaerolineaceae bacterium]|nr:hypothetical protein [Anaerolineaceae bacterium]